MLIHSIRNSFVVVALAASALASHPVAAQPAAQPTAPRPPVESFFQNFSTSGGVLSPNGKRVALRVTGKSGRVQLVIVDAEKRTAKPIVSYDTVDVAAFSWVNDKRLVFSVGDRETASGDRLTGPGLFAVDADGGEIRQLADVDRYPERGVGGRTLLDFNTRFEAATRDRNSDDIFVTQPKFDNKREFEAVNLLRVNTRTGAAQTVTRPGRTYKWLIDANDVPRVAVTREGAKVTVHYLEAEGKWTALTTFDMFDGAQGFDPFEIGPDGTLYVRAQQGGGTSAIYRFDIAKKAIDPEPVISVKGYDFSGRLIMDKTRLLGIYHVGDAAGTVWLDPAIKKLQASIDTLLPATNNILSVPLHAGSPYALVYAFSDVDPGTSLLFNQQTSQFTVLGKSQPGIDPKQMAQRDLVRYKARDGLEIPAWLTLPRDAKGRKVPLVVLVHGGPWVRGGVWNWNAESEFLASRGYAVLEPEFRGSAGYGFAHFAAGWKQWGLAMQNDIADGARWAVDKGLVDGGRICIAGASYGGYSALMGLVNDPSLYRCGIAWAGVSDIDLMYTISWSAMSADYKQFGMPVLIGDQQKDAEQLKATSPLQQAARIKQPLLLAHGGADRVVPIDHGVKMRDAVRKTNPNVEWVEYTEEGHGWSLVKNRVDFWTRVEKFLDRNIGEK
ncbi:MAG: prolyl oligopeptidase family serine peptidase [Pseudomonadota bacterium]